VVLSGDSLALVRSANAYGLMISPDAFVHPRALVDDGVVNVDSFISFFEDTVNS
jgi:hypothetical protein